MVLTFLVSIITPIWWFWFADISFQTAAFSAATCAVLWPFFRRLLLSDEEMMVNVFARGAMMFTFYGALIGIVSVIYRLIIQ